MFIFLKLLKLSFLTAIIVTGLFFSCVVIQEPTFTTKAAVIINLASNQRDLTVHKYIITASKAGEETVSLDTTDTSCTMILTLGTWHIEVSAVNSDGISIYYGYTDVDVTESGATATIGLLRDAGTLRCNMTIPITNLITSFSVTAEHSSFPNQTETVTIGETDTYAIIYIDGLNDATWDIVIEGKDDSDQIYYSKENSIYIYGNQVNQYNDTLELIKVTDVLITPLADTFDQPVDITLSSLTPGAVIYYTTDGTVPTAASNLYSSPIPFDETGAYTVRAIATKTDLSDSLVSSKTFSMIVLDLKVYFKLPSGWGAPPNIHYWNCNQSSSEWPGVPMADEGSGWYSYYFPTSTSAQMIFSDKNNEDNKTADLYRENYDGWYDNEWYDVNPDSGSYTYIKKGTYVLLPEDNSNTKIRILWQTQDPPTTCTLEWGATAAYGNPVTPTLYGDNQYDCEITDLTPDTNYYYKLTVDAQTRYGDFKTAPEAVSADVSFYAFGDTRTNADDHNEIMETLYSDLNQDKINRQTFLLHVGDFVNDGEIESDWDNYYFSRNSHMVMKVMSQLPIMGARGNHEEDPADAVILRKYYPQNYAHASSCYYSFDYGPVHVAVVDLYNTFYHKGSDQYEWLKLDLETTSKQWKVVVLHAPVWSSGGAHENNTSVQKHLHPLFMANNVQIVFNGDNHYYCRAMVGGIAYVTTGGGGAPIATPNPAAQPYIVPGSLHQSMNFVRVSITDDLMSVTALDENSVVLENFDLNRDRTGIKVHFLLRAGWDEPSYIHYWNSADDLTQWPGLAMFDEGDGWYYFQFPTATSAELIFNNNDDPKTGDKFWENVEGWYDTSWHTSKP